MPRLSNFIGIEGFGPRQSIAVKEDAFSTPLTF
jgi:hypothetical protein